MPRIEPSSPLHRWLDSTLEAHLMFVPMIRLSGWSRDIVRDLRGAMPSRRGKAAPMDMDGAQPLSPRGPGFRERYENPGRRGSDGMSQSTVLPAALPPREGDFQNIYRLTSSLQCLSPLALCAFATLLSLGGCAEDSKPPPAAPRYEARPTKQGLPDFMRNTVWERVDVGNTEPFQVSAYGLVVNLDNTGDSTAPTAVKQYILKEMVKHGYGSKLNPGWENQSPERVLSDKRVAIVRVVGMIPPGARKTQTFDVIVQALPKNLTSSLAGGELYRTDLKINGADPNDPFGKINDYAMSKGFVFVNPAYALNKDIRPPSGVRQSLRNGVIMDGGMVRYDRPLFLRLLSPERRMSRYIEQRIIDRFQDTTVASAQDEGIIQIFVPYSYRGDWVHFARLVTHLYLDGSPEMLAGRAKVLAKEAIKPDAKLEDISFCWEGIGPAALPYIAPLLTDSHPDVAYAAARAAAFIGDPSGAAQITLLAMAKNPGHPFQLNAIEALGGLAPSAAINQMLRELLDSDNVLTRIEAYKVLARNGANFIRSRVVTENPTNQKFVVDLVPSSGPPLIYATRTGMPRIALIGALPQVATPVMFSAMNDRLTISSGELGQTLTIFYRVPAGVDPSTGRVKDVRMSDPVKMSSNPDLDEVIERLGGITNDLENPLDFTYSEVVAILSRLNAEQKLVTIAQNGQAVPAKFVLQDPPSIQNVIYNAPTVNSGRPQADAAQLTPTTLPADPAADAVLNQQGR